MSVIDTHAHLNDEVYTKDLFEVLSRARSAGVSRIVLASANLRDSVEEMAIAAKWSDSDLDIRCTVGVHPHDAETYSDRSHVTLREWIRKRGENKIAALGEIGLDYHYDHSPREIQREVFRKQLDLAYEEDIPFVLHEREATSDLLLILEEYKRLGRLLETPGVCHCFSGSEETAGKLLDMGFYLGFDGPLTFKNSRRAPDVVKMTPLDRLVAETDAPYLTPAPFRGKRNEPSYVLYVLEKMAEIKGISPDEAANITMENACRLFRFSA